MKSSRKPPTPAVAYPPGWFTEPVRAWVQLQHAGASEQAARPPIAFQELAKRGRLKAEQTGSGWGTGTIVLPNTPKHSAPAWMPRPRARG